MTVAVHLQCAVHNLVNNRGTRWHWAFPKKTALQSIGFATLWAPSEWQCSATDQCCCMLPLTSFLAGQIAPKRAFTGAKVAYVAMTWALGCVVLPWTVKLDRSPTCPATAQACSAPNALLDRGSPSLPTAQGSFDAGAADTPTAFTMLLLYLGVAAYTAATVHNADVPDIAADRMAGIKTIAAAVGRRQSLLVSAVLALVGTGAGLASGCLWLVGVGPFALATTSILAGGWDELAIMLDDSQGILAGLLAAVLV